MKKFLCLLMFGALVFTASFEAMAFGETMQNFPNIRIAAARTKKKTVKKKAPAKKQNSQKNNSSKGDYNLLKSAILKNDTAELKKLINSGVNVNVQGEDGFTPLILAASRNAEAVRLLLNAGANVDVKDKGLGDTALIHAARDNTPDAVELLINAGANVNAQNDLGQTALMGAAAQNTAKVVEILLNAGADAKIVGISEYDDEQFLAIDSARANPKLKGTKALKMLEAASR